MTQQGKTDLEKTGPEQAGPEKTGPEKAGPEKTGQGPIPRRALATAGIVVAAMLGWGIWAHYEKAAEASQTQRQTMDFVPNVRTAVAKRLDGPVQFALPGTIAAFDQATIYARATGYIGERKVDIGSRVHKGDRLVLISAPDLDQQLAQANAQLVQMQAAIGQANAQVEAGVSSTNLAQVTNGRTAKLADQGWETRQNADTTRLNLASSRANLIGSQAGVKIAEANVAAQFATVQRLQQLVGFEDVRAPFDGIITSRSVDVGDLVSADSGGRVMFTLARDDTVRVAVDVPQSGAIGVVDGLVAKVHVPELPDRVFEGRVARSSSALAQGSRTMQAEVDVPNPDGKLRPGLYVTVDLGIPRTAPGVVIPAEAIIFNAQGLRVAVVRPDNTVQLRDVTIYRDFGTTVELRAGLQGGEPVVLSPPVELVDGAHVKPQSST
jgi:HlyD family secretion protein